MHRALALGLVALIPATAMAQSTPAPAPPAAAATTATTATPAQSDAQLIAFGRQLTDWWYAGEADSIYAHMSADARTRMDKEEFSNQRLQILMHIGTETAVVEDKMTLRKGNRQYWRESKVDGMTDDTVVIRWVFNPEGEVIGLGINPKARAPAPD